MNPTALSNWHISLRETFENLRFRANLASLIAKSLGRDTKLKAFTTQAFRLATLRLQNGEQPVRTLPRVYRGEQDLPLARITGSVDREADFDAQFRPLKAHLRERWIEVYAALEADRVPPLQVFKIGDEYYLEDGHYRVSAGRALGRLSLRARVWEIQLPAQMKACCAPCRPQSKKPQREMAHA